MADDIDWQLLTRYVADIVSPDERMRIEAWVAARPENRAALDEIKAILAAAGQVPARIDTDASWTAARARLGIGAPAVRRAAWARAITFASGALAASAAAWLIMSVGQHVPSNWRDRMYATRVGERVTVSLIDGTSLTLAPATTVRIASDFDQRTRHVRLVDGEAYFTVAHDGTRPFIVSARGAVVRDVGTAFDVRAYAQDSGVEVAVTEGEVSLRRNVGGADRSLGSGDLGAVVDTAISVVHNADVVGLTAWMRGELVFRDTPVRDMIPVLERWYDVEIHLDDPAIGARRVTATYGTQPVADMLDLFTVLLRTRYARQGRVVTVYPRGPGGQ